MMKTERVHNDFINRILGERIRHYGSAFQGKPVLTGEGFRRCYYPFALNFREKSDIIATGTPTRPRRGKWLVCGWILQEAGHLSGADETPGGL